jgi:hypothetical protein
MRLPSAKVTAGVGQTSALCGMPQFAVGFGIGLSPDTLTAVTFSDAARSGREA